MRVYPHLQEIPHLKPSEAGRAGFSRLRAEALEHRRLAGGAESGRSGSVRGHR